MLCAERGAPLCCANLHALLLLRHALLLLRHALLSVSLFYLAFSPPDGNPPAGNTTARLGSQLLCRRHPYHHPRRRRRHLTTGTTTTITTITTSSLFAASGHRAAGAANVPLAARLCGRRTAQPAAAVPGHAVRDQQLPQVLHAAVLQVRARRGWCSSASGVWTQLQHRLLCRLDSMLQCL